MKPLEIAREFAPRDVITILESLEDDEEKMAKCDVAYLPGLSPGMVAAGDLFGRLNKLLKDGWVEAIAVSGSDGRGWGEEKDYPGAAWPGVVWYLDELQARGIPRNRIIPITMGPQRQSLQETEALLRQAEVSGWRRIVMVTVNYHRPRQALGAIKQLQQMARLSRLYFPSFPFDWDAQMMGSQNREESTGRREAEIDWCRKVPVYQDKGDLASLEVFEAYIKWRDR